MSWALPQAVEYYGNSVTLSVSACRRSRLCIRQTLSPGRCPVRFLQPVHCRSLLAESVPCRATLHVSARSSFQLCYDGRAIASLETGVQAIQLSPCGQDLQPITLQSFGFSRFLTMLLSPLPFDARWSECPRRSCCSQPPTLFERSDQYRNGAPAHSRCHPGSDRPPDPTEPTPEASAVRVWLPTSAAPAPRSRSTTRSGLVG